MASKVIVTKEQLDRIDNAISTISGVVRARTLPEMAEAILQLAPSSNYVTHEEFEEAMSKLEGLTVYGTADLGSDPDCNYVSIDANSTDKIIITATNTDDNETYHLKVTESGISFILDGDIDPIYTLTPDSGIEYTGVAPIDVDNTNYEISIADATSSASGAMSATDKAKLDALPSAISGTAPISVSNGTVSIPQASSSSDGYMSSSDKSKLDTLPSSVTGTAPISVSNAGVVSISTATTSAAGSMSASDKTKLNGLPSSITGTSPISVSNAGVVSISAATESAAGSLSSADKTKLNKISVSTDGLYVGSISSNANTISLYGGWDDSSIGDYINVSYYKSDGLEASRINVGEDGIRFRSYDRASTDASFTNTIVWDIDPKNAAVVAKNATIPVPFRVNSSGTSTVAATYSMWSGWDNQTFGDYLAFGAVNATGDQAVRLYLGESKIALRDYSGGSAGSYFWNFDTDKIVTSASSPLSISNNAISIQSSTSSRNGYMSSTQASQLAKLVPYTPTGWEETVDCSYTTASGTASTTFTNLEIGAKMKIMWGRVQVTSGSSSTSKSTTLTIPGHSFKSGTAYRPVVQVTSMNSALNDVYANAPTTSSGNIEIVIGGTLDTASTSSYWVSVCLLCWHS